MKTIILSVLTFGLGFLTQGQELNNLVENPGFEQVAGKLKKAGAIGLAVGWISPTGAAADLFGEKYSKIGLGTPGNNFGEEKPHEGDNYAGFRAFSFGDKEARNYVSSKLKISMKKGSKYCVKFYVSLAEGSKYAANNISANFSKKQYNIDDDRSIMGESHVAHVQNPAFNGFHGWDEVCGVYVATGGEKFITIGNFSSNGETTNERMKKPKSSSAKTIISAYYYLDDISVIQIDEQSECTCEVDDEMEERSLIYEVAPINTTGLKVSQILQYTNIYFSSSSADFNEADYDHLNIIVDALKGSTSKVMITGHSDEDEVEDGRADLGKERAEKVKAYLVSKGVSEGLVMTENKKSQMPADDAGSDLAKAKNRRVGFALIK